MYVLRGINPVEFVCQYNESAVLQKKNDMSMSVQFLRLLLRLGSETQVKKDSFRQELINVQIDTGLCVRHKWFPLFRVNSESCGCPPGSGSLDKFLKALLTWAMSG